MGLDNDRRARRGRQARSGLDGPGRPGTKTNDRSAQPGSATVNELAEPFAITKQAISKHIQVLELAGLVTRTRDPQRRPVHLNPQTLESLTAWIDTYRLIHEQQFRRLDPYSTP